MNKVNLEFIKQKRKSKKLTLQEMAEALGFKNASTYMKYEKGEYKFRADHISVLSTELECAINDFF